MGYALLIDRFRNPALLPAATGLIFLRTAKNGNGKNGHNGNGKGSEK